MTLQETLDHLVHQNPKHYLLLNAFLLTADIFLLDYKCQNQTILGL